MKICILGLGYIGLPTAAVFAKNGVNVLGVDISKNVVETINQGQIHIVEPGLNELVKEVVEKGFLKASLSVESSDVFIICVPTPFKENYEPDLSFIKAAVENIAKVLKKGDLIILESTSPIKTTEKISLWLSELRADLIFPHISENADVFIAHCPERVLPGKILNELINNDRIIGGVSEKCTQKAEQVYKIFVKGKCIKTNARTAEMVKLTENSFRDVNIAFANELSLICERANINVYELIKLANHHPRVNILTPGCGVGGHCIAVDPWFIVSDFKEEAKLIKTARQVNDFKPFFVIKKIEEKFKNKTAVLLGLAFKPDIDDLRESPAIKIVNLLFEKGFEILVCEPNIKVLPKNLEEKCRLISLNEALRYENIAILVGHKEFKSLENKNYLDFCGIFEN